MFKPSSNKKKINIKTITKLILLNHFKETPFSSLFHFFHLAFYPIHRLNLFNHLPTEFL